MAEVPRCTRKTVMKSSRPLMYSRIWWRDREEGWGGGVILTQRHLVVTTLPSPTHHAGLLVEQHGEDLADEAADERVERLPGV